MKAAKKKKNAPAEEKKKNARKKLEEKLMSDLSGDGTLSEEELKQLAEEADLEVYLTYLKDGEGKLFYGC